MIWLAYELIILIGPSEFRDAAACPASGTRTRTAARCPRTYYVLGALGLGLVFYVVQMVTEREAMRSEPGQELD